MVLYKQENLLISGAKNGSLFFWNENGNIVKKMQLLKTPISNLIIVERPPELEDKKAIIQLKKTLLFKPFKKFVFVFFDFN